jgi:3-oxoacyl-(acyl-carrier-protein) synthase
MTEPKKPGSPVSDRVVARRRPDAHWDALNARRINVDDKRFAPYIVHPLAPVSFDAQIPKKGDQRQMEAWQRIGTYAAGLALDSAGSKAIRNPRADGHDRRGRWRRARRRGRHGHSECRRKGNSAPAFSTNG